jgi:catechol 2,3-dioxygenase-like lactoylglutathione lyase family enzyme
MRDKFTSYGNSPSRLLLGTLESAVPTSKQKAHLDHLTMFVSDASRSRDWYTGTLGLNVEFEVTSPRAVALQDSSGFGLFVEQRPIQECKPSGILTFRVGDVDSLAHTLQANGVKFSAVPQKLFLGVRCGVARYRRLLVRLWDEQSMKAKGG